MTTRLLAVLLAVTFCSSAGAEIWIGAPSTVGPVQRPAAYTAAVTHLFQRGADFERYSQGVDLAFQDLGGFYVKSWPVTTARIVRGKSAGAQPSSGMNSLYFTQSVGSPTTMYLNVFEPVMSMGFTLMGMESPTTLRVFGGIEGQDVLGEYTIPAMVGGMRRWIGVYENERVISRVQLAPKYSEDYAIDDVQIGVHAPEPGSLALLCVGAVLVIKRGRRGDSIV